jgi:NitT/TauT family transport system ATP-binding protein
MERSGEDAVTAGAGVTPSVALRDVTMVYRSLEGQRVTALRDVSGELAPHEFVVIVGPSGCGKSTLLRLVAGLVPATHGSVAVNGAPVTGPVADVGIVFQDPVLMVWRTALRNVVLPIEVLHGDVGRGRRRAAELLAMVGLGGLENRYPHELSGGQQHRVAIARALVHDPALLLMDEPFGALDEITREQMGLELLRIWEETHKTVLFVTHSVAEAVFLGDRVIVMSGRPGTVLGSVDIGLPRPRTAAMRGSHLYTEYCQAVRHRLETPSHPVTA